jgi:hypothetical protein
MEQARFLYDGNGQHRSRGHYRLLSADMVTSAKTKGLFGGISLEGAGIAVRDEENRHYYGKDIRPTDILVMRTVSNPQSADLRDALAKAAAGQSPSQTVLRRISDQAEAQTFSLPTTALRIRP